MQPNQQEQSTGWQFVAGATGPQSSQTSKQQPAESSVTWTASEFIAYHKSVGWYTLAFLVIVIVAGVLFFLTRDFISVGSIVLLGFLFMAFAARKPRVLTYSITSGGVKIGDKLYAFSTLRSFAVIDEGSIRSISLYPMKRFMPAISMYFEPQEEQRIVGALGQYLALEERKQDPVDKLMHKIRF